MESVYFFFSVYLPYLFGGGQCKYRVRLNHDGEWIVQTKGGGMGPFWGFGHFTTFFDVQTAKQFAQKWASERGGVVVDAETRAKEVAERWPSLYHTHKTETGLLVRCYHKSKSTLLSPNFWLGVTLSFPLEHFIWTKVWPFAWITSYFGLLHD